LEIKNRALSFIRIKICNLQTLKIHSSPNTIKIWENLLILMKTKTFVRQLQKIKKALVLRPKPLCNRWYLAVEFHLILHTKIMIKLFSLSGIILLEMYPATERGINRASCCAKLGLLQQCALIPSASSGRRRCLRSERSSRSRDPLRARVECHLSAMCITHVYDALWGGTPR
jgi:hypothetical protein